LRLIIFANGWLDQPFEVRQDDVVIAADGGTHHALAQGIVPSVVIGDLDSVTPDEIQQLNAGGAKILKYPHRKDYTDLELALQYAREQPADEVVIVAALGARWDQTMANLLLPATQPDLRIMLMDGSQEIHYLVGGETLEVRGFPGDTVSLIALSEEASGIVTEALEYPLQSETLYLGSTRGVSNVMQGERARVHLGAGRLMCTVIHHPAAGSKQDAG
jgi:thiamine pyrophosphokinase